MKPDPHAGAGFDLDTPEGRLAAVEALGPEGYNRAMADKLVRDTVLTVNGHPIRTVMSRFGRLYAVGATGRAFGTLGEATTFAAGSTTRSCRSFL